MKPKIIASFISPLRVPARTGRDARVHSVYSSLFGLRWHHSVEASTPRKRALTHRHACTLAAQNTMKTIAVIFGNRGGMSDAGKFAAAYAMQHAEISARLVSVSRDASEGGGHGLSDAEVDVKDGELRAQLARDLADANISHADMDDETGTLAVFERAIEGCDAVVACVGARQGKFGVWIAPCSRLIVQAMQKHAVQRLVILSSMGIGQDFMPLGPIRVGWRTMLATVLRNTRRDLTEMERIVSASDLQYLLVRPVGLTPGEPPKPREQWKTLTTWDGAVNINIAKKDVGMYMVHEALTPTLVRTAVTLGSQPKS